MPETLTVSAPEAVPLDWLLGKVTLPETELVLGVTIALCSDRRANPDDTLPVPGSDDRRGWWGDTDAERLHDGGPIGSRLYLLDRTKITGPAAREGSLIAKVETYCREALAIFRERRIASRITVLATRTGTESVDAKIVLHRGPGRDIELRFAGLWQGIRA